LKRSNIMGFLFGLTAIVQMVLHYLGWLGVLLGIVALLFGNTPRGVELLIGGFAFIVVKYVIGFLFQLIVKIAAPKTVMKDPDDLPSN
jgi:hypothetical protein